jgi:hypothetical protein
MKILEVPTFNPDGSIRVTHLLSPEEAQGLLQFALNFLTAAGMAGVYVKEQAKDPAQGELKFND